MRLFVKILFVEDGDPSKQKEKDNGSLVFNYLRAESQYMKRRPVLLAHKKRKQLQQAMWMQGPL